MEDPVDAFLGRLRLAGFEVGSACDLINLGIDYEAGIPVLLEALSSVNESGHRMCIVRALGRKSPHDEDVIEQLKAEFVSDPPQGAPWSYRWTVGNSIELLATAKDEEWLLGIASDESFGPHRERIVAALGRLSSDKSTEVLERLLADPEPGIRVVASKALASRKRAK